MVSFFFLLEPNNTQERFYKRWRRENTGAQPIAITMSFLCGEASLDLSCLELLRWCLRGNWGGYFSFKK